MSNWYDRVKINITSSGTGETVDLGSAASGFRDGTSGSPNANIPNATVLQYTIEDSTSWEVGEGTYNTGSPPTFSRTTVHSSSNSGSPINLSGSAVIFFSVTATSLSKFGATFSNSGLKLLDTAGNNTLTISPSENLTADRVLSVDMDDANRTLTLSGNATISGTNTGDQTITLTGDVTGSGTGSFAATVSNSAITNAKMANMAASTFKGRVTASTGAPEDLTATQATSLLNAFVGDSGFGGTKGLVPAPSTGDATKYLKGDGTWATVSGSVADADYGDITVSSSGAAWTIDNGAVSLAKMANLAQYALIGRSSSGAGVPESVATSANVYTLLGSANFADFRSNLGIGNVENTALSTWTGSTSITTLGTIATGTWQGTDVGLAYGGTGATLADPNADRIMFWDDSAGSVDWLAPSAGLTISGTNLTIDSTVATLTGSQTLTNKTLTAPVISTISNTGTLTLPTSTDTLVGRDTTDTLTNKTLTSPTINGGTSSSRPQASSETLGTLTSASANKTIQMTGGVTINDGVFSTGDVILLYAGSASRTITQDTGMTLRLGGTETTGNITLAARGIATVFFISSTEAVVGGTGVT